MLSCRRARSLGCDQHNARFKSRSSTSLRCSASDTPDAQSLEQAWILLRQFNKSDVKGHAAGITADAASKAQLRAALQTARQHSNMTVAWDSDAPNLMLGILASDIRLALRALRDWTMALQVPHLHPEIRVDGVSSLPQVHGTVFVKYNSQSRLSYVTSYTGEFRGVLVNFGEEQFGHFPLGLWDEGMQQPEPALPSQSA